MSTVYDCRCMMRMGGGLVRCGVGACLLVVDGRSAKSFDSNHRRT